MNHFTTVFEYPFAPQLVFIAAIILVVYELLHKRNKP